MAGGRRPASYVAGARHNTGIDRLTTLTTSPTNVPSSALPSHQQPQPLQLQQHSQQSQQQLQQQQHQQQQQQHHHHHQLQPQLQQLPPWIPSIWQPASDHQKQQPEQNNNNSGGALAAALESAVQNAVIRVMGSNAPNVHNNVPSTTTTTATSSTSDVVDFDDEMIIPSPRAHSNLKCQHCNSYTSEKENCNEQSADLKQLLEIENKRDKLRQEERDLERQREFHRQEERELEQQREKQRERERELELEREQQREVERELEKQRQKQREREREIEKQLGEKKDLEISKLLNVVGTQNERIHNMEDKFNNEMSELKLYLRNLENLLENEKVRMKSFESEVVRVNESVEEQKELLEKEKLLNRKNSHSNKNNQNQSKDQLQINKIKKLEKEINKICDNFILNDGIERKLQSDIHSLFESDKQIDVQIKNLKKLIESNLRNQINAQGIVKDQVSLITKHVCMAMRQFTSRRITENNILIDKALRARIPDYVRNAHRFVLVREEQNDVNVHIHKHNDNDIERIHTDDSNNNSLEGSDVDDGASNNTNKSK